MGGRSMLQAVRNSRLEIVMYLLNMGFEVTSFVGQSLLQYATCDQVKELIIEAYMAPIRAVLACNANSRGLRTDPIATKRYDCVDITDLPEDIYRYIQAFTPINALLNSSKCLVEVKRQVLHWKLTRQYSLLYSCCPEFRELFISNGRLLRNCNKQVSVDMSWSPMINSGSVS